MDMNIHCDKTKLRESPKAIKTEDMKTCITCGVNKSTEDFEKRADTNKMRNQCKECRNIYVKQYKQGRTSGTIKPRDQITSDVKTCTICKVDKPLEEFPKRDTRHGYRHECKHCKKLSLREYYQNTYNKVRRDRKTVDMNYKLMCIHRNHIHKYISNIKTSKQSSITYLGCSIDNYKKWLEFQFDKDVNWNNYGSTWTIDHVLPLSLFNLQDENEKMIGFNWKNTRPCKDNFQKSNKLQVYHYFNTMISLHRFIQNNKLDPVEYQGMRESLCWLRKQLRYGNKLIDDVTVEKMVAEMGNPHPNPSSP